VAGAKERVAPGHGPLANAHLVQADRWVAALELRGRHKRQVFSAERKSRSGVVQLVDDDQLPAFDDGVEKAVRPFEESIVGGVPDAEQLKGVGAAVLAARVHGDARYLAKRGVGVEELHPGEGHIRDDGLHHYPLVLDAVLIDCELRPNL